MGRRRGGGGASAARKPVAAPAKRAAPPPPQQQARQQAPPPPAPVASAPPPAMQQPQGGGLMSGFGGMVAQGMALGVGSSIGHKMVDGAVGMFSGSGSSEQPAPQQQYQEVPQGNYNINSGAQGGACADTQRELYQCLQEQNQNAAACQFYFDALRQCQENTSVTQFQ